MPFGKKKKTTGGPSVTELVSGMDTQTEQIYAKIKRKEQELVKIKQQLQRASGSHRDSLKRRAMMMLREKKRLEQHYDQISRQASSLQGIQMMSSQLETTAAVVSAMRESHKAMKKQFKRFDISKLERMRDEMEDLQLDAEEIQETLTETFQVDDAVDDAELEAELGALDEELAMEEFSEKPSYLQPAQTEQVMEPAVL
eukprot:gnl/Dysnectes_brevis/213_a243_2900.p2 GENE.gnl/Dysnectes_brevis/213_a243_2900~~gnl/Dysnectes_brevis/213_a243_2900.p2  ORF type:complete len:199 (-),score=86.70 gnl/Dysnectes_brevis/213_a243_2900:436-1032(-)